MTFPVLHKMPRYLLIYYKTFFFLCAKIRNYFPIFWGGKKIFYLIRRKYLRFDFLVRVRLIIVEVKVY